MSSDFEILLVEDTLTQAMLYQHQLELNGFKARIARSAQQALEILAKEKPILVLSDINMPEISGLELCRRLKDNVNTQGLLFVLLGTALKPAEIVEIINSGADDFLLKNIDQGFLFDKLRRLIEAQPSPGDLDQPLVTRAINIDGKSYTLSFKPSQAAGLLLTLYEMLCISKG